MADNLSHSYDFTVNNEHIDELNHVNNVVYVQWIQDAAVSHWNAVATPEMKKNFVWFIVRHEIDYKRSAKLNDVIHIKTMVLNAGAASSVRQVQIFRKEDNQLLVESKTTWCIIDTATQRPSRIPDDIKEMFLGEL